MNIFKIKVLNFNKHNPNRKPSFKKVMLTTNFFNDPKIFPLPNMHRLCFIYLVTCAGDAGKDTVTISQGQLNAVLRLRQDVVKVLFDLQENQLVTVEILNSSWNGMERNRREWKGVSAGSETGPLTPPVEKFELEPDDDPKPSPKKSKPNTEANRKCWEAYRGAYRNRWGVDPLRDAKTNSAISNFVKRVGEEDAPAIIEFYVSHNDGFYLKQTHAVGLALKDAETLRTQWLKGQAITQNDVNQFTKQDHYARQMEKLGKGEL